MLVPLKRVGFQGGDYDKEEDTSGKRKEEIRTIH